jgi:hypothetical protein
MKNSGLSLANLENSTGFGYVIAFLSGNSGTSF